MSKPSLKVTNDFTKQFMSGVAALKGAETLVGIPEEQNTREDASDIGNAALLFINNFGSPMNNIPPRPVMDIGIRNAKDEIAAEMKNAVVDGLSRGPAVVLKYQERVGIIASNSVKKVINEQIGIAAPSPATLKSRKYLTQAGFMGTKALIVTGQMRNAITYVVRSK